MAVRAEPIPEPRVHTSPYHSLVSFHSVTLGGSQCSLELDYDNPSEGAFDVFVLSGFPFTH